MAPKFYVLESVPIKENYIYSKKLRWINAENLTEPRIEFYDRKGRLLKIWTTEVDTD